jgi:hypothetical protein
VEPPQPESISAGLNGLESVLGVGPGARTLVDDLVLSGRATSGECLAPSAMPPTRKFDAVIYLGTHHRLVAEQGIQAARKLWNALVNNCQRVLIFGAASAPPQPTDRRQAKYLLHREQDLLLAIGPRLRKVDEITASVTPGSAPSRLWRLWLHPGGSEFDVQARSVEFYGQKYSSSNRWEVLERLGRSNHEAGGNLISLDSAPPEEIDRAWTGTTFYRLREAQTGEPAFAKKLQDDPLAQMREFGLLEAVEHPRVVKLLEVHRDYGLVFPYIPGQTLRLVDFAGISNRAQFCDELVEFFKFAGECRVRTGIMDPHPGSDANTERRLAELVDFNIHNFLIKVENGRVSDWAVVDLAPGWRGRTDRNRSNLRKILRHINGRNCLVRLWRRLRPPRATGG